MNLQREIYKNLQKSFDQDHWTLRFIMIFNELDILSLVQKKKDFAAHLGIDPTTLTNVLNGQRNFPVQKRQHAMDQLAKVYQVNLHYFKDEQAEPFTVKEEALPYYIATGGKGSGSGAMTYGEISEFKKLKEEVVLLRQQVQNKDQVIAAQNVTITALQEALKRSKD